PAYGCRYRAFEDRLRTACARRRASLPRPAFGRRTAFYLRMVSDRRMAFYLRMVSDRQMACGRQTASDHPTVFGHPTAFGRESSKNPLAWHEIRRSRQGAGGAADPREALRCFLVAA